MRITNLEQAVEALTALQQFMEDLSAVPATAAAPKKRKSRAKKKVDPQLAPEPEPTPEPLTPVEEFKMLVVGQLAEAGKMIRARGGNRFTDLSAEKQQEILQELRNE